MRQNSSSIIKQLAKIENRNQIAALFRNPAFFKGITEPQVNYLVNLSSFSFYKKGQHIIRAGDIIKNFNIILKGRIKVYLLSKDGKVAAVDIFRNGDPFLLGPIFDDRPSETNALALEDTVVVHINKRKFRDFVMANRTIALNFFKELATRLINALIRARDGLTYKVDQRLIKTIQTLYDRYGKTIDFKGHELAELAGTTNESVSRFMNKLKRKGIIATTRGKFIILDEDKFKNFTVD